MRLYFENPGDWSVGIPGWWAKVNFNFTPSKDYQIHIGAVLRDAFTEIADFKVIMYTEDDLKQRNEQ